MITTAGVSGCKKDIQEIIIPQSIKEGTKEYDVTSILDNSFKFSEVQLISIAKDSRLRKIGTEAFAFSKIKSFTIPSELVEIKEGWCCNTPNLTKITVDPRNPRYICYENQMIFCKTKIEQSNYDCLIFCVRDAKNVKIPDYIEHICSFSFDNCKQLQRVIISNKSNLHTIDCNAFIFSSIENFTIPSKLIELKAGWCNITSKLTEIKVSPNNPRYCCFEDKVIIGKTNIEQSNYDCLIFCVRDAKHIKIPNFIEHISSNSFQLCKQLETIEFSDDSKLKTIGFRAFYESAIKSIKIPSSVTSIEEEAFRICKQLQQIEFSDDSKLQSIDTNAFAFSSIDSIKLPSELVELKEGWNSSMLKLIEIKVSPQNPLYCCYENKIIIGKSNIDQSNYDCLILCVKNIKYILKFLILLRIFAHFHLVIVNNLNQLNFQMIQNFR